MIGTTLGEIRSHIEGLASDDGTYVLVCARYGDRPVPAAGLRFESRASARAAADATERYRAALRRYDPRLPYYDVIVCQEGRDHVTAEYDPGRARADDPDSSPGANGEPGSTPGPSDGPDSEGATGTAFGPTSSDSSRSDRVEFCHRVAAAVFEALSAAGHDAVESAVVDAYVEYAERVGDLDDLCLRLLERMAAEIDRRLTPDEQAEVVATAAGRLPAPPATDHPVGATLTRLERRGLLGSYLWSPSSADPDGETRAVNVLLSDYALSPHEDRLPVLPVVVELVRHGPRSIPTSIDVDDVDDGWLIRLEVALDARQNGLASASIRRGV
ncbi:DUF7551 domain-containing protein [Halorarum halobium]|uniref:DUF7551 domain-containing protein n=1 Tax=Halorarum halobium TaxID=3075121 RepID=UPI0028B1F3EC|nr:hypothetical protein [Halobaculum sp. XH14]